MPELIKTKYIETALLYEVTISPKIPRHRELIAWLDSIGVITEDADVFVLNEDQYRKFADYVRQNGYAG